MLRGKGVFVLSGHIRGAFRDSEARLTGILEKVEKVIVLFKKILGILISGARKSLHEHSRTLKQFSYLCFTFKSENIIIAACLVVVSVTTLISC